MLTWLRSWWVGKGENAPDRLQQAEEMSRTLLEALNEQVKAREKTAGDAALLLTAATLLHEGELVLARDFLEAAQDPSIDLDIQRDDLGNIVLTVVEAEEDE